MPRTVRRSQWLDRPARQVGQAPQVALISPTTRRPSHAGAAAASIDDADELVPEHAGVRVVAAHQLQVGVAHAGDGDADPRLAGRRFGDGQVVAHPEAAILEPEAAHGA